MYLYSLNHLGLDRDCDGWYGQTEPLLAIVQSTDRHWEMHIVSLQSLESNDGHSRMIQLCSLLASRRHDPSSANLL